MKSFTNLLQKIHTESFDSDFDKKKWDSRPAIVLMVVALCLLMLYYLKFNTTFFATLKIGFSQFSQNPASDLRELSRETFFPLVSQAWWSFWHLITFILIPILTIKYILKEPLKNYGLGLGRLNQHIKWYIFLAVPILCFVVIVSFRDDFTNHYPFYKFAHRSWVDLITWEILYLIQFVCVEFFFRGFIIQACRPAFGVNAIFVMIIPYMMIHLSKPWLEASGAIFFGLFLGILAFQSRSIWGGVLVHVSIALSMDIAALLQTKGLPQQWLP
jgi:membrane protease YdiL (CAAX protease family)